MRRAPCGMRLKRSAARHFYNRSLVQANRSLRSETTRGECETPCKARSLAGGAGIRQVRRRKATPGTHISILISHIFINNRRKATPDLMPHASCLMPHASSLIPYPFYNNRHNYYDVKQLSCKLYYVVVQWGHKEGFLWLKQ